VHVASPVVSLVSSRLCGALAQLVFMAAEKPWLNVYNHSKTEIEYCTCLSAIGLRNRQYKKRDIKVLGINTKNFWISWLERLFLALAPYYDDVHILHNLTFRQL
jgi:hypothetical protein